MTPTGGKAIEEFRPGDAILARSEHDSQGPVATQVVEETFVRVAPIMALQVRGREIRTTAEHPFFVRGKGWICAKEVEVGDEFSSHDGQWVTVEAVTDLKEVATVYNLRVSDYHTYFVGSREWGFSVWAHNANYAVIEQAGGGFRLAQVNADGTLRYVTEAGTSRINVFASRQAAREAVESGGGRIITLQRGTVPNRGTTAYHQLLNKENRISNELAAGGNRGISGTVNHAEADFLGERFVGGGFSERVGPDGQRILISQDGLRQYRSPTTKNSSFATTGIQANFQSRPLAEGTWVNNVHINVLE